MKRNDPKNILYKTRDIPTEIQRLLVVFDVDGMIIKREHNIEKYTEFDTADFDAGLSDSFTVPRFKITLRKGIREFFDKLFAVPESAGYKVYVALWTSSNEKTYANYLRRVIPNAIDKMYFIWDRSRCALDPERGTGDFKKHATVKKLSAILESPTLNEIGGPVQTRNYSDLAALWTENNVLIIDDDAKKLRFNPAESSFVFSDFDADINKILKHPFFRGIFTENRECNDVTLASVVSAISDLKISSAN